MQRHLALAAAAALLASSVIACAPAGSPGVMDTGAADRTAPGTAPGAAPQTATGTGGVGDPDAAGRTEPGPGTDSEGQQTQ